MKEFKLYLVILTAVVLFSAALYWNGSRKIETKVENSKDRKILVLEEKLETCLERKTKVRGCKNAAKEIKAWKELAESCVSRKTETKKNER